jgi:hypothetical protein
MAPPINVEQFVTSTPSTCLPPHCVEGSDELARYKTDASKVRVNTLGIFEKQSCPTGPANDIGSNTNSMFYINSLNTINPLGGVTADNKDLNLYSRDFDVYRNKIFVNCGTANGDTTKFGICDSTFIPTSKIYNDNISYPTNHTDGYTVAADADVTSMAYNWYSESDKPKADQYKDVKQCLSWCKNNPKCQGVQSVKKIDYPDNDINNSSSAVSKQMCNYYGTEPDNVDDSNTTFKEKLNTAGDDDNNINLVDAHNHDLHVKRDYGRDYEVNGNPCGVAILNIDKLDTNKYVSLGNKYNDIGFNSVNANINNSNQGNIPYELLGKDMLVESFVDGSSFNKGCCGCALLFAILFLIYLAKQR